MTDPPRRAELAARQAELLGALVTGGPVPEGFEQDRVSAQARALVAKRREVLSQNHPEVVEQLGARFPALFAEFCDTHPPRTAPGAEIEAFRRWLTGRGVRLKVPRWRWPWRR